MLRAEPMQPTELQIRVSRLLQALAERRVLQKKTRSCSASTRCPGRSRSRAAPTRSSPSRADSAEMLKAERGLVMLYDSERRQLVGQVPGFGLSPRAGQARALLRGRRGRLALELPQERAAALEQGPGRHPAAARDGARARAAVADGRADHARPADSRAARGGRPRGPRALLRRGPEPAAGAGRPGHDRGREPAAARGDQEGERAAAGVRPPEERVRRHRRARLPPAADGDPRLRRARRSTSPTCRPRRGWSSCAP